MVSERTTNLLALVKDFKSAHLAWVSDNNRPNPDDAFRESAEAMIDGFAGGDVPSDCRAINKAVLAFAGAYNDFLDSEQSYPNDNFWRAQSAVFDHLEKATYPALRPLESLKSLREQKVSDEQICRIYGFVDRQGRTMPWLVDAELDKPGSVLSSPGAIDGRTWEDPRVTELRSAERAAEDRIDELLARKEGNAVSNEKPCPESPRDLWRGKVPIAQSAKMLRMSEQDVQAAFERLEQEAQLISLFNRTFTPEAAADELGIDVADVENAFAIFAMQAEAKQPLSLDDEEAAIAKA